MSYSEIAGRYAAIKDKHREVVANASERVRTTQYELERYMEDKAKGLTPDDSIITESIDRLRFLYGRLEESR